jgi:DNA repair exonuclease SbcCD ATPase subunit
MIVGYVIIAMIILCVIVSLYNFWKIRKVINDSSLHSAINQHEEEIKKIKVDISELNSIIKENQSNQALVDLNQNSNIEGNSENLRSVESNVDNIEQQMLAFDGNFKSLDSIVNDLERDIGSISSFQFSWNEQFSNQQNDLKGSLAKIEQQNFDNDIERMKKEHSDISSSFLMMQSNLVDLGTETLRLADIVDTQDIIAKTN